MDRELLNAAISAELKVLTSTGWGESCEISWQDLRAVIDAAAGKIDPRLNALHWSFDVINVVREIAFSFASMKAHADAYKDSVVPGSGPSDSHFYVSYFADNAITRVYSCREKIALMAWSFIAAFDPDDRNQVLTFGQIRDRFRCSARYGIQAEHANKFLGSIDLLDAKSFELVTRYRHLKIHRREPRIEIYRLAEHQDRPYLVPACSPSEVAAVEERIRELYPGDDRSAFRASLLSDLRVDGILYDERRLRREWIYDDVQGSVLDCLRRLQQAAKECFDELATYTRKYART